MKKNYLFLLLLTFYSLTGFAQAWTTAGTWVNSSIDALKSFNGTLYLGGNFTGVGTNSWNCSMSAKWNGTTLSPIYDSNIGGSSFSTFTVHNSTLYAGGFFTIGSFGPAMVAQWTGSSWDDPTGNYALNSNVYALASFNSSLYVGGYFTNYNSVNYNHIAVNSGSGYATVGSGFDGQVNALIVYNNELYAGGSFANSGATPVSHIAKWNGSAWVSVGTGVSGTIKAMTVLGSDLYVVGSFTTAGAASVHNIAKWNGSAWSDVSGGLTGGFNGIRALITYNNVVYVGGDFTMAGSVVAKNVAAWNGSAWSALGTGVNSMVNSLEVYNGSLYAGPFAFAGDTNYLWKYSGLIGINEHNSVAGFSMTASGNGVSGAIDVNLSNCLPGEHYTFTLYNIVGQSLLTTTLDEGRNEVSPGELETGIYICDVISESGRRTSRIYIQK